MSVPTKESDLHSTSNLPNRSTPFDGSMDSTTSFRNTMPGAPYPNNPTLPPLPPRPNLNYQPNQAILPHSFGGMAGPYGMGGYGNYGYGGFNGGYGMGGMAGPYNGFNNFGPYGSIESRFIRLAEDSSRPAFESIQGLVNAVGSVAMMLENTFFALTSSFRAILGVAENFGRLRSLFAQFWSTFAVLRSLNWLIRKLMVMLGIRTENEFKAWAEAVAATQAGTATAQQQARGSSWPILLFFGVVAAAPYIVLKMMSNLSSSINERLNDPSSWQNPLRAIAQHDFEATSPQELSFRANQVLTLAPQELQGQLWQSGWLMATADKVTAGLIPTNYIKVVKPTTDEVQSKNVSLNTNINEPSKEELNRIYEQEL